MKEIGWMINSMVMVLKPGKMEPDSKEIMWRVKNMEKENLYGGNFYK